MDPTDLEQRTYERLEAAEADLAAAQAVARSLADRVAAQSELLAKRAEVKMVQRRDGTWYTVEDMTAVVEDKNRLVKENQSLRALLLAVHNRARVGAALGDPVAALREIAELTKGGA